ncbi:sorbosone dehydrogenase family protein [Emticicia sp. C21]|uniref:PQQ-dependent sugar dehydrogenase n=1 Tax=Emticicia sp. C21 TaxID=2302915 RepID=UPI0013145DAC|nr:PQQ-dependent sugar dehydrogenase [Emticicia sp. C21]
MKNLSILLFLSTTFAFGQYNTFYLSPSNPVINPGQSVNLAATGCAGSVSWSTGQIGTSITVFPTVTTKISANCSTSGVGQSNNEVIVEVRYCSGSTPENITVNSGLSGGTHVFEAKNSVTGTSFINANTNVHFKAGKGVALNTGFEAKPGSIFKATIEPCNDTSYLATRRVANKLNFPWEILWGPDNFIWMTERGGKVSRVNPQTGQITSLLTIPDVLVYGEGGLLGMVLHPDFSNNPYVYIVYNYGTTSAPEEKVVRYTYNGATLISPLIILDNILGSRNHNGSRLVITPDLKLFITTGDAENTSLPQDTTSINGKILRINLDGTIPADNPYAGSPVWSIGHRNPQGMVYANSKLYVSSHGASREDEINLIQKRGNYGWVNVEGPCDTPAEITFCNNNNVILPIFSSGGVTWAFCGLDYYNHSAYPAWQNNLLMVSLKNQTFYSFQLSNDGNSIVGQPTLYYNGQFGRLRDIAISPDGKVYICTSNGGNNDQLVEIKPMVN